MTVLKILLVSGVSLVILFILTKLMGNKQISQMNLFDYITGITIGSIAAELATELEEPLKPAAAMILYGVVTAAISFLTSKSNKARAFFAGKPIILMRDGKLSREQMKKSKLDLNELLAMARLAGYFDLSEIDCAIFEQNGTVSFLPKAGSRPATPEDMRLPVKGEGILANIIVDSQVMEEELRLFGKDKKWLLEQLKKEKLKGPEEVFLATLDREGKLTVFPAGEKGGG